MVVVYIILVVLAVVVVALVGQKLNGARNADENES